MSINRCIKLGVRFSKKNLAETVATVIIGLFIAIHFGILLAADAMQKWEMASDEVGKVFEDFAVVGSWVAAGCKLFLMVSPYLGPVFSFIDSCGIVQKIKQCLCARCGDASDATNVSPKRSVAYGYGEHEIHVVDLTKNGLCIEKTIHLGKEHRITSFTLLRNIKKIYVTTIHDGSVRGRCAWFCRFMRCIYGCCCSCCCGPLESETGTLWILDMDSNEIVERLTLRKKPTEAAVTQDGEQVGMLYPDDTNPKRNNKDVSVVLPNLCWGKFISLTGQRENPQKIVTATLGAPYMDKMCVIHPEYHNLSAIDLTEGNVVNFDVSDPTAPQKIMTPENIVAFPKLCYAFIVNSVIEANVTSYHIMIVDIIDHNPVVLKRIPIGRNPPKRIMCMPDGLLYITVKDDVRENDVVAIIKHNEDFIRKVRVGIDSKGMAVSSREDWGLVADAHSQDLFVIWNWNSRVIQEDLAKEQSDANRNENSDPAAEEEDQLLDEGKGKRKGKGKGKGQVAIAIKPLTKKSIRSHWDHQYAHSTDENGLTIYRVKVECGVPIELAMAPDRSLACVLASNSRMASVLYRNGNQQLLPRFPSAVKEIVIACDLDRPSKSKFPVILKVLFWASTLCVVAYFATVIGFLIHAEMNPPPMAKLYMSNFDQNSVAMFNIKGNVSLATIPVEQGPNSMAVSLDQKELYVASWLNGILSVMDTKTNRVMQTYKVGKNPQNVTLSPDGTQVWLSNRGDATVSVFLLKTGQIQTISVGKEPGKIVFTSDGARACVLNTGDGTISIIDARTYKVLGDPVDVGLLPQDMAIDHSANEQEVYVISKGNRSLAVVDVLNGMRVRMISIAPAGMDPRRVVVSGIMKRCYVSCSAFEQEGVVVVVNVANNQQIIANISMEEEPGQMVLSPDHTRLYVANEFRSSISVVDTATNTVSVTIWKNIRNTRLKSLFITPDGDYLYVLYDGKDPWFSRISTNTTTYAVETIPFGGDLRQIAFARS
jgi:YVTN family beta-propeller protein